MSGFVRELVEERTICRFSPLMPLMAEASRALIILESRDDDDDDDNADEGGGFVRCRSLVFVENKTKL